MGGGSSVLANCSIDDTPILTTKEWSLHHGENPDHGHMSVFVGQESDSDAKIATLAQNLRQYRHPSVLRYLGWNPHEKVHGRLFTEKVSPLSVVRGQQSQHAICLGLWEISQAIHFLHETCNLLHNNICTNAVFVTGAGRWKLGGLEFATKINSMHNPLYQQQAETARDVLALGILVTELLQGLEDGQSIAFREFASRQMLLPDSTRRPSIEKVLEQPFFGQDFVVIFSFLRDITLKTEEEKDVFFKSLGSRLALLGESVIGQQYVPLLLSRYVLMDQTARSHLLPRVLVPKSRRQDSLLSDNNFQEYVVPQLRTMFLVYDTGIRLELLNHFTNYCHAVDLTTLEDDILPAILVGLRDSDPVIVSSSLRALADLVPILGPHKVIGTSRSKVFSDGSPLRSKPNLTARDLAALKSLREAVPLTIGQLPAYSVDSAYAQEPPEQPPAYSLEQETAQPDPGIHPVSSEEACDPFNWDSWEVEKTSDHDEEEPNADLSAKPLEEAKSPAIQQEDSETRHTAARNANIEQLVKNVQELDILKLDVKLGKPAKTKLEDEVDFFADMTPNIVKASEKEILKLDKQLELKQEVVGSKFAVEETSEDIGWEDEDFGWNDT